MRPETATPVIDRILTGHYNRDDTYWCYRSAGSPAWSIIYTVSGHGRFATRGHTLVSGGGDVLLIPAHASHDYETSAGERWELLWVLFHPRHSWATLLNWPGIATGLGRVNIASPLPALQASQQFFAMHDLALRPMARSADLAMNALEAALFWIDQINCPEPRLSQSDPATECAIDYISRHLAEPLSLTLLARISEQSVSRLCHEFKRRMGIAPLAFIERQRLERACQLLHRTSLSVKEVSRELGFSSPFYFSRRFHHRMGLSPSVYRTSIWADEPSETSSH